MLFIKGASLLVMAAALSGTLSAEEHSPPAGKVDRIFELRQYTLHEGKRDTLISIFEKNFIESQNALGADIYGVFRDLDDPDRFVWIRGFRGMPERQKALTDFYGGPVWQSLRAEANPTMLDSDNVMLLQALTPSDALEFRPPHDAKTDAIIGAFIYYVGDVDPAQFAAYYDKHVVPQLSTLNARVLAQFVSENSPNNFPKLPVREKEKVFVWLGRWNNVGEFDNFLDRFRQMSGWRDAAPEAMLPAFVRKPEILRLKPAVTSPLK